MILRLAAIAPPVLAGTIWMALTGASTGQLAVQLSALAIAAMVLFAGDRLEMPPRACGAVLLALLYLPLLFGPTVDGTSRWVGLGPVALTTAPLCLPALCVLLARARRSWFVAPLVLIFLAGLLQPDPSIPITLACVIVAIGGPNLVALAGGVLLLGIGMATALRDTLQPVRFVEGVLADALSTMPPMGVILCITILAAMVPILLDPKGAMMQRRAVAASLVGLTLASLIGPYPTPLVGYGPAAIIGLSLALAMLTDDDPESAPST